MTQWQRGQPVQLDTERFVVRSLQPTDATKAYVSWWNDSEIRHQMGREVRNWTFVHAFIYIEKFDNKHEFHLGIFVRGSNSMIGYATIRDTGEGVVKTKTIVGDKSYWGKSVVLEVRAEVMRFAFEQLNAHKITGRITARNFASAYNYKAQGFKIEGIQREHLLHPDGSRHDQIHFGLLRSEWEAQC